MVTDDPIRLRAELQTFPPYIPGRAPADVAGLTPFRLSSNENHLDPLPAVLEQLARPGSGPTRYPDDAAVALRRRIGEVFGVSPERTIVTTGASELLVAVTQITSDNRTEAIYPWPSFEMYPQVTGLAGAKRHAVDLLPDGRHDLTVDGRRRHGFHRPRVPLLPQQPHGPRPHARGADGLPRARPAARRRRARRGVLGVRDRP